MGISKKDFYKGQTLYLMPTDSRDKECEVTVFSVGRKYVYLGNDNRGYRIDLSDEHFLSKRCYELKDYGFRGMFFFGKKDLEEFNEAKKKKRKVRVFLDETSDISLAKLTRILEILEEN